MASALQVNFRGVAPSEGLVEMASAHHRELIRERPTLAECLVVIEATHEGERPVVHALVHWTSAEGDDSQHGEGKHADPRAALRRALQAARDRIANPPRNSRDSWTPWAGARLSNRPLPRAH
jgi:hypothetical protein